MDSVVMQSYTQLNPQPDKEKTKLFLKSTLENNL